MAAVVAVTLTGFATVGGLDPVASISGVLLVLAAAVWYWFTEARIQPEVLPKLTVAGLAVLVLLSALLYGLLVTALGLPAGLASLLYTLLLALAAGAVVVIVAALVDLALLTRARMARHIAVTALLLLALRLAVSAWQGDATEPLPLSETVDLTLAMYAAASLMALLGLIAPLEWVVAFDRRQRRVLLLGWAVALIPLAVGVSVQSLLVLEHQHLLMTAVRSGSIVSLAFVVVILIRAMLALPGTRAYERKTRELDAIYDFGLAAGTAFNPQELQNAVLASMLAVADPEVALMVEPVAGTDGCDCVLLRSDNVGEHVYRFNSRSRWDGLEARFADRRPVVIGDHGKAPPGVLERIWEPASGSSVIVPVITQDGVPQAILIVGRFERHAFNNAEVRSLAGFANQVALAMDHARLLRDTVEAERRERELEIARELQLRLLPTHPPQIVGLDIADRSEPATEVGGDYFDYLDMPNGKLAVVVGDVSGHGMPAGLLMAMAKSAIHTLVGSGFPAEELMKSLGETLLAMSADNQFMTLVFTEIDLQAGTFRYSNAGHHYPLHYQAANGCFVELESTGLPMAMLPRPPGPFRSGRIEADDLLVFYSDGVVEAMRADEEMFGPSRLRDVILANRAEEANTIVSAVFLAVRNFVGDLPLQDDATIVVVRVTGETAMPGEQDD